MKTIFFTVAAMVAATSVPAFASPNATAGALVDKGASTDAGRVDTKRYCVVDTPTGSRVPRRQCATRVGWAEQGITLDMLLAK